MSYIEQTQQRVKQHPDIRQKRKELVEHPFGPLKFWWDHRHFLMRGLQKVRAEFSLSSLAYNIRRVLNIWLMDRTSAKEDFPIVDLLDDELSSQWLSPHFHPDGLKCPHWGAGLNQAREFRQTKTSQLWVYRCTVCQGIYNLYSRTAFEGRYFRPAQVVLLLRGVTKGQPSAEIAREIGVSRQTVLEIRHELQAHAQQHQPQTALKDERTETDEMFQNAGEKR